MTDTARALTQDTPRRPRLDPDLVAWCVVGAVLVGCFALRRQWDWLTSYPGEWTLPIALWINAFMDWFVESFHGPFRAISWLLGWPTRWIQGLLQWLPWPATIAGFAVLALAASGWRLATFTAVSLFYMVVLGYWSKSMNTMALVFVAVPMAVAIGLFLGIASYKSRRVDRIVQPVLDLMQTVPSFAYLIPILLLFGFGPVVGLIASAIYACPPMVRNTILGLQRVPSDVVESGLMAGATRRQLLWWVQVPSALPTIMVGVNQTVMAGLAMVIIAAIIGSSEDIGWEVLSTMRKAQFGQSLLSGVVIVLIAMVMDRISRGFTDQTRLEHGRGATVWARHTHLWSALIAIGSLTVVAHAVPALRVWPEAWIFYPAETINDALNYVITNHSTTLDGIKRGALFYFLLPLRVGLESAVRPATWGFELTSTLSGLYTVAVIGLGALSVHWWSWRAAVGVVVLGTTVYFGVTNVPWPAFVLVVTLLAWQVGGWRLGVFSLAGLAFMLAGGVWPQAMLSVYLCGAAVLSSFVAGALLGAWAAHDDRVSAIVRPVNDTLQTIPLFVFLIPVLMFFQVGEFTAFLSIIMYAIVPAVRYTEHGLRNVRADIVEAATSMGCSRSQMLWQVKLPLALPEIMLGLNQTIMFGLAMLVIAALVGTRDLGQAIYIALGKADTGLGMIAGLSMALIAMIADRIIQAWSAKKKAALGL